MPILVLIPLTIVLYIVLMIDKARSIGHAFITFFCLGLIQYILAVQIEAQFTIPAHANHMGSWLVIAIYILIFLVITSIIFAPIIYHYLKKLSASKNTVAANYPSKSSVSVLAIVTIIILFALTGASH